MKTQNKASLPDIRSIVEAALKDPKIAKAIRIDAETRLGELRTGELNSEYFSSIESQVAAIQQKAQSEIGDAEENSSDRFEKAHHDHARCLRKVQTANNLAEMAKTFHDTVTLAQGPNLIAVARRDLEESKRAATSARKELNRAKVGVEKARNDKTATQRKNEEILQRAEKKCQAVIAKGSDQQTIMLKELSKNDPMIRVYLAVKKAMKNRIKSKVDFYDDLRSLASLAERWGLNDLAEGLRLHGRYRFFSNGISRQQAMGAAKGEVPWANEIPSMAKKLLANGERIVAIDKNDNEVARWVVSLNGDVHALPKKPRYWKTNNYKNNIWALP